MEIIDAHHHLWDLDPDDPGIPYGWQREVGAMRPFGDPAPIQRSYLIDELLAEPSGVTIIGSVHIQCDGEMKEPVQETRWLQSVADRTGMPNAIIGLVDMSRDGAQDVLHGHTRFANFRGVRQIVAQIDGRPDITFRTDHVMRQALWREQFALLEQFDLSFDLQLYPEQMAEAAELFARYPRIPVAIDHCGSPYDQSAEGLRTWREGLALLAGLPHLCIKLSGWGMYDRNWTAESVAPMADTILELFGPERSMFGSNYPVDKLMTTYDHIVGEMLRLTANLPDSARSAIFRDTARRFYRF